MGFAAAHKEEHKLVKNGPQCKELGWENIPLVVETYDGGEKSLVRPSSASARDWL